MMVTEISDSEPAVAERLYRENGCCASVAGLNTISG
jgi:hypothetical protein